MILFASVSIFVHGRLCASCKGRRINFERWLFVYFLLRLVTFHSLIFSISIVDIVELVSTSSGMWNLPLRAAGRNPYLAWV